MSDSKKDFDREEEQGYVPSSPVKRTMAWIALVYVLLFLALTTYFYFTGTMLGNLGPLLTVPGLIGLGVLVIVNHKTTGTPGRALTVLAVLALWGLAAITLPIGLVGLMSNFEMVGVTFFISGLGG